MTKRLHIALLALLGLSVLAACRQANPEEPSGEVQQVTEGPVKVSLDLSLKGFGQDNTLTKGEFYDPANDFIEVDDSLFYDHEKLVKTARIYFFDATGAFDKVGGSYKFNPENATFIKNEVHEYAETLDRERGRIGTKIELVLDKPYESLAVIILANYGSSTLPDGSNMSMKEVVENLAKKENAMDFNPTYNYIENGIPMHGWKVFGSLEGLPSSATDIEKAKRRLRYYKGMTTPLTVCGFESAARLEQYAKETTGEGVVSNDDHVAMDYALARLQLRYVPKPKAIQADSVVIKSVKLNVYKDHIRMLPLNWFDWSVPANRPNPYTYPETAYDPLTEVVDFKTADVDFKKIDSKTGESTAFVAYVPEILAPDVKNAIDNRPGFKEPSLKVEVEVTFRPKEKPYGPLYDKATYIYERNKITVKYGSEEKEYENYGDEGWLSWLKFRTIQEREDIGGSPVTIGTRFSLVRHYSYEWVAVGVNE